MNSSRTRILTAAGVAGPVLWAAAVVYSGAIRPGYDPVDQFISELAERGSSTEGVMRVSGFFLPGLLVALFGVLLFSRSAARAAAVLITIYGAGRVTAGMFPCDAGCPTTNPSFSQVVHNIAALISGFTLPAAALVWFFHLRKTGRSGPLAWYSLASGILALMFLLLLIINVSTRHNVGLYQRLSLGIASLWLAVLAVSIWRSRNRATASDSGEQVRVFKEFS